jgi:hypothetical protein
MKPLCNFSLNEISLESAIENYDDPLLMLLKYLAAGEPEVRAIKFLNLTGRVRLSA